MMIWVAEITSEQAEYLRNEEYTNSSFFNPFEVEGIWYISEEEVLGCDNPILLWVRRLPLKEIEI
jgi:hypothetical protein